MKEPLLPFNLRLREIEIVTFSILFVCACLSHEQSYNRPYFYAKKSKGIYFLVGDRVSSYIANLGFNYIDLGCGNTYPLNKC